MFGQPHINLFATKAKAKLPMYMSPVPDPMAWKHDAFQHLWDNLSAYAFLPFALPHQVLLRVLPSTGFSLLLFGLRRSGSQIYCRFSWRDLSNSPCCGTFWFSPTSRSFITLGNYPVSRQKGWLFESRL